MRWFFALNEASATFWDYANLVQVARRTIRPATGARAALVRHLGAGDEGDG